MVIINQNKDKAIENIELRIVYDDVCGCYIETEKSHTLLGFYGTEERTKEVFQEIIERYANWENLKAGQPTGICEPVYYMPRN